MGFFTPAAFLGGAALLLAILAIYLLRPRRPTRRVSSTFLWLAALNDMQAQRPWRRVPPSVLLLLQIGALVAIASALARPFVLSTQSTGPFSVVLLDASASMQATDVAPSRFEVARGRVGQLIETLEPAQTLALVSLDARPRVLAPPTSDRALLRQALQTLQPTTQSANLAAALSVAASLAEGHADAQIVIVADGALDRTQIPASNPLPIRYLGVGTPEAANLAVAGLGTRLNDGHVSALARVINYGPRAQSASLVLRVDGARFDSRSLSLDAGGAADAQWDDLPGTAHTLEARLEGDPTDAFPLDNSAFAVLGGDRPTRVLLVSDGNVFVERALGLRPATQVSRVSPGDYVTQAQAFDLIVLDGFVPPVLPAGSNVLVLHPPQGNQLIAVGPDISVSTVGPARVPDPLVADVPLGGVHVGRSRRIEAPAWADVILQAPETPLLLVGEQQGRRLAVLGFDVHQSDLPLQPAFPVLIQHLLDWLVPRTSTATPVVQVGDPISLAPLPETTSLDVIRPDGQRVQVGPPLPPPPFNGTDLPGLYQVVQRDASGRETTSYFAANFLNARESQIPGAGDSGAPPVGPRREPLKAPQEFWIVLAVAALVLLGIEFALSWWQFIAATLRARFALALRLTMAAALALALSGVALPQPVDRQATIFVADASASVADAHGIVADYIAQAVTRRRPDDVYAIVDAARGATVAQGLTQIAPPSNLYDSSPPTDATDLAAGMRLAANLLPTGYRARIVLLSDGQETTGDAVAQARQLQSRGIEVDVVPLPGTSGPEVLVDSVSAPTTVHEGERFSIGVRLTSNVATDGIVHVSVNGQPIADQPVSLRPGSTDLAFGAQAPQAGLLDVRATLEADQDTLAQNNEARAVVGVQGPPRVLVVEQRPGEGSVIGAGLTSTGMRVETRPVADMPDQLDVLGSYAAVVLADVSAQSLTDAQQTTLRSYVRDLGRGLLAIGGDTSFGQGEYIGTPLDDALPVRSSVRSHRDQGRVALLLVLDRSGSMADDVYSEGTTKIEMARQAATLSAQQLAPRDLVGILAFDSYQHWILPMASVLGLGPTAVQDRLAGVLADGGTDIFPAVSMAFDAIRQTEARYKHVILLTDGMSCCGGNYPDLLDRMRGANVTLSTIAIGGDADQALLQQLAHQGDGRYYFAEHARDIPRLMTRETELAIRGPVVEGAITPRQVGAGLGLSSLTTGELPRLGGYLVTTPKDLAEVMLVSDAADPLLARWQYGLGRSVAWTSDLRGRWSENWIESPRTAQLFSELVGWTIAPAQGPLRLAVRADAELGHVTVDETQLGQSSAQVHAHVAQPNGAALELDLPATAPGRYEASFPIAEPGSYFVRVEGQHDGAPIGAAEAGLAVAYPAEFRQVTPDPRRLTQIARAGGGHTLVDPAGAFGDDLAPVTSPLPLQRILLVLAAILLPLDIALRRLRISPTDILDWLRHPRRILLDVQFSSGGLRPAAWMPGAWAGGRRAPPPTVRPFYSNYSDGSLGGHVTPGLARQTSAPPADNKDEDDALGETLRWLAARRGPHRGDSG